MSTLPPARRPALLAALAVGVVLSAIAGLSVGAVQTRPGVVLAVVASWLGAELPAEVSDQVAAVVTIIRAPRVLLGILVGAGLSVSGALMQGLFRNPLADPGLIGVSSGAALAAAGIIVLGGSNLPLLALPAGAFCGGALVTLLVMRLARRGGRVSIETMLLAGVAVNAIAGAGTGILVTLSDDAQLRSLTFWTLGSLGGATWPILAGVAPLILLPLLAAPGLAGSLNALLLGEEEAHNLGVSVERLKRGVVLMAALIVGASVAFTGIIGFVGLVVPHLIRLLAGPDHRIVLPGSALLGAALLVSADLASRTVIAPAELPIGVVTTLLGGPFFLGLLARKRWM